MKIPDVVLQEASEALEMLEGTIVYLGKIGDGRDECTGGLSPCALDQRQTLEFQEIIKKILSA